VFEMTVVRWTDEMVDALAASVTELRESMRESATELRESARASTTELRESIAEVRDSVDGLRITAQALLQVAAQSQRDMEAMKERQAESDQRFNVLLEEVRFLNRGNRET
jgi:signal transduction histidine kinase